MKEKLDLKSLFPNSPQKPLAGDGDKKEYVGNDIEPINQFDYMTTETVAVIGNAEDATAAA